MPPTDPIEVLDRLLRWAESRTAVRALILESSRAIEDAPLDALSDYDILVVVPEVAPFLEDARWFEAFGEPLVSIGGVRTQDSFEMAYRLVHYRDATKIDYQLWPIEALRAATEAPRLPDLLDVGYRVLLDKDGLAASLPPATQTAHIPAPPTAGGYTALVEEFWWDTTYVAKNLWRDELLPARYSLDVDLRRELLQMLEWWVETEHDWSIRPGRLGRHLKQRLDPSLWTRLEATFAGADIEANWGALFATTSLFGDVSRTVGARLGHLYPADLEAEMSKHLRAVRRL